jgi:elongation factor Ts
MMEKIKELREQTGAGIMDAKKAIEEAGGDMEKAKAIITAKGLARAESKADREVSSGKVYCYTHGGGTVAAMVEVACETDFVAKTPEFEALCKELAMQIVSMDPKNTEELLAQDYIRDSGKTIDQVIKELSGKTGENIRVTRFVRFKLGMGES